MESVNQELKKDLSDSTATDDQLREKFKQANKIKEKLSSRRFELNLKIRKIIGSEKMKGFDVLGPPPPPRGDRGKKSSERF